jgi:hypothetical protein
MTRSSPSTISENRSSSRSRALAVLRASSGVALRVQHHEVGFAARREVADHALETERARRARGVLPPEMLRTQADARLGLAFAPHVVGSEHRVERREAGAAADVAGQPEAEADPHGAFVVEEAAAQEQVAGGADRRGGAGVAHQRPVFVVDVDAMRIDGALAHQAEVLVDGQVAARCRKQFARPADLVLVLRHVRLDPHVAVARRQFAGTAQLRLRATGREARRDGVPEPVAAMPAADQRLGVDQRLLGLVAHPVGRVAVLQHLARDHAQAAALRLLHQGVHRVRMRSAEGQRRGDTVALQFVQEDLRHAGGIGSIGEARLVREGVVLQPGQQAFGGRTDHVGLREVDVQVDEARGQDAPGQVRHRDAGKARGQRRVRAGGTDRLAARGVGADDQQAVGFVPGRPVFGKGKQCGAIGLHRPIVWPCPALRIRESS